MFGFIRVKKKYLDRVEMEALAYRIGYTDIRDAVNAFTGNYNLTAKTARKATIIEIDRLVKELAIQCLKIEEQCEADIVRAKGRYFIKFIDDGTECTGCPECQTEEEAEKNSCDTVGSTSSPQTNSSILGAE